VDAQQLTADGWKPLPTQNFSAAIGTAWIRGEPGDFEVALVVDEVNQNDHMAALHGGALMTFADIALGCAAAGALGHHNLTTAQIQVQFTASAPIGTLVIARPEVVRQTRKLVFVRSLFIGGDKTIASADGIFAVLDPEVVSRFSAG
jgi:uncharacterized protein (TIGR00369 family)